MNATTFEAALAEISVELDAAATALTAHLGALDDPKPVTIALAATTEALARCRSRTFEIAVVGAVKAGKSTLLNAMVFGDYVLPVAAIPCTAKLTIATHAPQKVARATMLTADEWLDLENTARRAKPDGKEPENTPEGIAQSIVQSAAHNIGTLRRLLGTTQTLPWSDLSKYAAAAPAGGIGTDGAGQFTPVVASLRIEGPLPAPWDKGVVFVDTPGLNDPVRSREAETQKYLSRASAVILVLYAGAPMSQADSDILCTRLVTVGLEKLVVVVNKVDIHGVQDRAKVIAFVRDALRSLTELMRKDGVPPALLTVLEGLEPLPASGLVALHARTRGEGGDLGWYTDGLLKQGYHVDYTKNSPDEAWRASGMPAVDDAVNKMVLAHDGKAALAEPVRKAVGAAHVACKQVEQDLGANQQAQRHRTMSVEELIRERENLTTSLEKVETNSSRRVASLVNDLAAIAEEFSQAAARILADFQGRLHRDGSAAIEREIGIGAAFSNSARDKIQNLLEWQVRELSQMIESEALRFRGRLQTWLPQELQRHLSGLQDEVGLRQDSFLVESASYVRNLTIPDFDAGGLATLPEVGFWEGVFQPGAARARLVSNLQSLLKTWQNGRRAALNTYIASIQQTVKDEYVFPAILELKHLAAKRRAQIGTEITAREGSIAEHQAAGASLTARAGQLSSASATFQATRGRLEGILRDLDALAPDLA